LVLVAQVMEATVVSHHRILQSAVVMVVTILRLVRLVDLVEVVESVVVLGLELLVKAMLVAHREEAQGTIRMQERLVVDIVLSVATTVVLVAKDTH
jgi:hypothetical protein